MPASRRAALGANPDGKGMRLGARIGAEMYIHGYICGTDASLAYASALGALQMENQCPSRWQVARAPSIECASRSLTHPAMHVRTLPMAPSDARD